MAFLSRPPKRPQLVIRDYLKPMLCQHPETFQLSPHDSVSLGLVIPLQRLNGLALQRVIR